MHSTSQYIASHLLSSSEISHYIFTRHQMYSSPLATGLHSPDDKKCTDYIPEFSTSGKTLKGPTITLHFIPCYFCNITVPMQSIIYSSPDSCYYERPWSSSLHQTFNLYKTKKTVNCIIVTGGVCEKRYENILCR